MPPPLHRVVVTGASGFVGRALCARFAASVDALHFGQPDWRRQLDAVSLEGATVFHLAARVHAPRSRESEFVADNVDKTRALAEAAVREGARQVVYLSTSKVYGEESPGRPFTLEDVPRPQDAYGRTKLAAEQALTTAAGSHLPVTLVRAPLVHGPGARANLAALLRLADTPWPLPFASLSQPRSWVHVDDLVRLLVTCAENPAAAGRTFIAAASQAVSAAEMVSQMRRALGRPARLFPMPAAAIEAAATVLGQGEKARRLTRELRLDSSGTERNLGWVARVPIEQSIEEMVRDYRARQRQ